MPYTKITFIFAALFVMVLTPEASSQQDTGPEAHARHVAHTGQLVFNGDFEVWEGNVPAAWEATKPEALSVQSDPGTGRQVLAITADELLDVRQRPSVKPLLPGDVIIFRVDCHSAEAGGVETAIRMNHADTAKKPTFFKTQHPGGGWQQLTCVVTVPEEALGSIEFRIRVPGATQTPIQVRSATAEVVPAIP